MTWIKAAMIRFIKAKCWILFMLGVLFVLLKGLWLGLRVLLGLGLVIRLDFGFLC